MTIVDHIIVYDSISRLFQLNWNDCFHTEGHAEVGFPISLGGSGSEGPEDLWKLLDPQALSIIKFLFECFLDNLVDCLDLTICLWMCRKGIKY